MFFAEFPSKQTPTAGVLLFGVGRNFYFASHYSLGGKKLLLCESLPIYESLLFEQEETSTLRVITLRVGRNFYSTSHYPLRVGGNFYPTSHYPSGGKKLTRRASSRKLKA